MTNTFIDPTHYQHTLKDSFSCLGRGLHSGNQVTMSVLPAEPNTGFVFIRRDIVSSRSEVPARWNTVTDTRLSTTISNAYGIRISTIEHLLAALQCCGIDNARIILNSAEVPIMDGSALSFTSLIQLIGRHRQSAVRMAIVITKPVTVKNGHKQASFIPSMNRQIDMEIDFDTSVIGKQRLSVDLDDPDLVNQISSARTFGFQEQLQTLKKLGLAQGGSLQNAILIDDDKIINEGGLRYQDEFVRHKVLDAIGDLSVAGTPIVGKFIGKYSGHQINNTLLRELMIAEDCWVYTSMQKSQENWEALVQSYSNISPMASVRAR